LSKKPIILRHFKSKMATGDIAFGTNETPHTCALLVLLASGLLLQGCSLQKRTLVPGWHVERVGQASAITDAPCPEMMPDIAAEEPVPLAVTAPTSLDRLIPVKALMAYSPPVENAVKLQMLHNVQRAELHAPQSADEVDQSAGVESTQPSSTNKEERTVMGVVAALLIGGSVFAFRTAAQSGSDAAPALLGVGLLAIAWRVLRYAYPKGRDQLSEPTAPEPPAEIDPIEQPSVYSNGIAVRIAMGLLSVVLGLASIPSFSLGFFDPSLALFALLGVGFLVLAWRSFLVAFPNLRSRFEKTNSRYAARRAKREARLAQDPNRQWMWLLALIPVALLILFAASLSFPAFGM